MMLERADEKQKTCCSCHAAPRQPGAKYCRPCRAAYNREWRKTHPLTAEQRQKDTARSYAGVYKRRGVLQIQNCVACGDSAAEMHHEDYSRPLDVIWLCRQCHMNRHMFVVKHA